MMSVTWPTTFSTLPMASDGKTVFACAYCEFAGQVAPFGALFRRLP